MRGRPLRRVLTVLLPSPEPENPTRLIFSPINSPRRKHPTRSVSRRAADSVILPSIRSAMAEEGCSQRRRLLPAAITGVAEAESEDDALSSFRTSSSPSSTLSAGAKRIHQFESAWALQLPSGAHTN